MIQNDLKYQKIQDYLLQLVQSPESLKNGKLPSETALVKMFSVSRGTVHRAISDLTRSGLLVQSRGSGTYVAAAARGETDNDRQIAVISQLFYDKEDIGNQVVKSAMREFQCYDYHVACYFEPDLTRLKSVIGSASGILFNPFAGLKTNDYNDAVAREVLTQAKTMVLVDKRWPGDLAEQFSCVGSSNEQAGYDLASYILARGVRRLAVVYDRAESGQARYAGYLRALKDAGIVPAPEYQLCIDEDNICECGVHAASILTSLAVPPEVIFCINDRYALNVMRVLRQRGRKIPGEIGVCGFDNSNLCEIADPQLFSVSQNTEMIGEKAAQLLMAHLDSKLPVRTVEVDCRIVPRESVRLNQTVPLSLAAAGKFSESERI